MLYLSAVVKLIEAEIFTVINPYAIKILICLVNKGKNWLSQNCFGVLAELHIIATPHNLIYKLTYTYHTTYSL